MPISPIVLQRRHAELGRIRLGDQQPVGDGKTRPNKLSMFRFTSVSERYIRDLAELYGGQAQPWDNGGIPSWEVYTTAKSMPVIAVKGGLSQWMEFWAAGGCMHRCDGETNVLTGEACDVNEKVQVGRKTVNPHSEAKPTTRLSLMLPELEAIGVWRLESHGWNAAAEIPAVAELAQYVGDLVPAHLHLVERRSVKDGKTSRFVVPVLDLQIGTARLREIVAEKSGVTELAGPTAAPALEAATPLQTAQAQEAATEVAIPTPEQIAAATLGLAMGMVTYLEQHGLSEHPATVAARARVAALSSDPQPDAEGVYEAEVVEQPATTPPAGELDPDAVWAQVLKAASDVHGWGLSEVLEDFKKAMGIIADEASAAELQAYLHTVMTGEVPAA